MGATTPALRLPLCSKSVAALPSSNTNHCGRRRGEAKNYSICFDANECGLRCSSSSSSKVSCGGAIRSRSSGLAEPGRKVAISSGLWRSRAGIGLSSFSGTWVGESRCNKGWNSQTLDARRGGRQRCRAGRAQLAVRMMWGGGKVEAPKPNYIPLEEISGEDAFNKALDEAKERGEPIIVDWLASWCRKCIYLKPKLEKLAAEYHPNLKFYCVDVNAVPQALVKRANVTKMPTIQLWKNGDHVAEVIGGHQAWLVMDEIREMITLKK